VIRSITGIARSKNRSGCPRSDFLEGGRYVGIPVFERAHRSGGDHAIETFRDVEDDVDAATPVDAQNAPAGVWKSRKEREIPTAPTSIIFFSEEEERRTKPLRSIVHRIGSPPGWHQALLTCELPKSLLSPKGADPLCSFFRSEIRPAGWL
jgi:hypothetical protein